MPRELETTEELQQQEQGLRGRVDEARSYLSVALEAREAGLCPVRVAGDGTKRPAGAWKQLTENLPTPRALVESFSDDAAGIGLVCGRVSGGLEMLEVEGRFADRLPEVVDALNQAGLGELWERVDAGYRERTPSGGFHWLYRLADGDVPGNLKLAQRPAPEGGREVLIETRGEGGFVVVAPTGPEAHRYEHDRGWVLVRGGFATIAKITPAERVELHRVLATFDEMPEAVPAPRVLDRARPAGSLEDERPGDRFNRSTTWPELLEPEGWQAVFTRGEVTYWRRPGKAEGVSATTNALGTDTLKVFSTSTVFDTEGTHDRFGAYARLRHSGDLQAAARSIRPASMKVDPTTGEVEADTPTERPALAEEFWTARRDLEHVRRAAHSRGRSAPATLGAVLARIAAGTPHVVKLPPIVGGRAGLSFFVGIVGPPGAGKSSAADIAGQLVKLADHVRDHMPIGTGEGMIDVLFAQVNGDDGKGKEWRQAFHNAFFWVDEGQMATAIADRSGATLMPVLRTVWSDGTLGQSNAAGGRDRRVPAGAYVYGMGVAFQESKLRAFFDDRTGGTPQRFAWASATDPAIPEPGRRPAWPGPLEWSPPDLDTRRSLELHDGMYWLDIPEPVRSEIVEADYTRATGRVKTDEFSAHGDLLRLKMAALLAILDRRVNVTAEDWQLAGMLKAYSDATGAAALRTIRAEATKTEADTSARLARRKVQEVSAVEAHRTYEAARRIADKVHVKGEMNVSALRRLLPRWRAEFYEGLDLAIEAGWVIASTEPGQGAPKRVLRPGPAKP